MASFRVIKTNEKKVTVVDSSTDWRTYDGSSNNLIYPWWGVANYALKRVSFPDYGDGVSSLAVRGPNDPSPRVVSNAICQAQADPPRNDFKLTDMTWVWGQFVDHEIGLTNTNDSEPANMFCSPSDPNEQYPGRTIPFNRSVSVFDSSPRQQPSYISAFIDGTNIYGFDSERAYALRKMDGSGKLKTTTADNGETLLPYNTQELTNAQPPGTNPQDFFVSGDVRVNENIDLTSMHTLFMKEHNRLCDIISQQNSFMRDQDEMIFNYARRIIIGLMQNITFTEYLPRLIGELPAYDGYKSGAEPTIATEFSTALYRLGHAMLSSRLRINDDPSDFLLLRDAFFQPSYIQANGTENIIFGASQPLMKKINNQIIDDIRNFLFGPPTSTMLHDLASLNMQRGRDHGLPGYNTVREAYGLPRVDLFSEVVSDSTIASRLADLYVTPDNADPWLMAISEDHVPGLPVGPLVRAGLRRQFLGIRDGDRFWFEVDPGLSTQWKDYIKATTLGDVIKNNITVNLALKPKVRKDVFTVA